jgi:hypothetical protein
LASFFATLLGLRVHCVKAVRDFFLITAELPGTIGSMHSYQVDWDKHPATNPWRQAREALTRDAEAALPER